MVKAIEKISDIFKEELNLEENDAAVVKYSLTVYSTTVIGYLAIILVAWPLGVLNLTFASAVTGSLLRIFSGGAHASCSRNCILSGAVIFPVFGLIARYFIPNLFVLLVVAAAAAILAFWSVYRYAPAETPGKPISTMKQKNQLRRYSFVIIFLWSVWVMIVYIGVLKVSYHVLFASALGLLWQGFSLTPAGYRLVKRIDSLLNYLMKEVEK